MNVPPTFTSGKHSSLNTERRATARAITISYDSRTPSFSQTFQHDRDKMQHHLILTFVLSDLRN